MLHFYYLFHVTFNYFLGHFELLYTLGTRLLFNIISDVIIVSANSLQQFHSFSDNELEMKLKFRQNEIKKKILDHYYKKLNQCSLEVEVIIWKNLHVIS